MLLAVLGGFLVGFLRFSFQFWLLWCECCFKTVFIFLAGSDFKLFVLLCS